MQSLWASAFAEAYLKLAGDFFRDSSHERRTGHKILNTMLSCCRGYSTCQLSWSFTAPSACSEHLHFITEDIQHIELCHSLQTAKGSNGWEGWKGSKCVHRAIRHNHQSCTYGFALLRFSAFLRMPQTVALLALVPAVCEVSPDFITGFWCADLGHWNLDHDIFLFWCLGRHRPQDSLAPGAQQGISSSFPDFTAM